MRDHFIVEIIMQSAREPFHVGIYIWGVSSVPKNSFFAPPWAAGEGKGGVGGPPAHGWEDPAPRFAHFFHVRDDSFILFERIQVKFITVSFRYNSLSSVIGNARMRLPVA